MSLSNPCIAADYDEYLHLFRGEQAWGLLPEWFVPLDLENWLSRQTLRYFEGRGGPRVPRAPLTNH